MRSETIFIIIFEATINTKTVLRTSLRTMYIPKTKTDYTKYLTVLLEMYSDQNLTITHTAITHTHLQFT